MAFKSDLGQHRGRPAVVLADVVASHGPQVNQTLCELDLQGGKVTRDNDAVSDSFQAYELLGHICSVQAVDAVRSDTPFLLK